MSKRVLSVVLCLLLCIGLVSNIVYADNAVSESIEKEKIELLVGNELGSTKIQQIEREINALKFCLKDVSNIKEIRCKSKNEYVMDYNGIYETIIFNKIENDKVSFEVTDGQKQNSCTITTSGEVIINGNRVLYSNEYALYGTVWKSTYKGTIPYGSLTSNSYNKYLSSGRSNAKMDDKIKNITITVLGTVLARFVPYAGIALDIANITRAFLVNSNPNSNYVSCTYDTYICGSYDYQYRTKVYATENYSGSYKNVTTYEHFIVY